MKNDVVILKSKFFCLLQKNMGKTVARGLVSHTTVGVVSKLPKKIDGFDKLNTCCLSCVFIAIVTTWFE